MRHRVFSIIALLLGCGLMTFALAQSFRGSIVGLISDASGAIVPEAKVTLTEIRTGVERTSVTNSTGNYTFPDIIPGVYKVMVSKTGFKTVNSSGITITTNQTARFDAVLDAGDINQTIEVTARASSLNTENAQLADVRTRDDLVNLPLNSRGTTDFRYVTSSNYDGGRLGGQRSSFGYYSIDGVSAMAPAWGGWSGPTMLMSLEAVQEIKLVTSLPSAEYGDVATVYVGTRSGGNAFHGSTFYEHSNYAFNARNFFQTTRSKDKLHEFGGSFSGPVTIPKLYDGKNRTFFFVAYEGRRQPAGQEGNANVPTVKMRAGDFSDLLLLKTPIVIKDPTTGQPFTGNIIPQNRLNAVSLKAQAPEFMPLPNFGAADGFASNYRAIYPNRRKANFTTIRLDHTLRTEDSLSVRLNFRRDDEPRVDGALPAFRHTQTRDAWNAYLSETHLFTPRLVNEFRISYARDNSPYAGVHKGAELVESWGIQGLNLGNKRDRAGVPQINWTNFSRFFEINSFYWAHQTYELLDNVTWTKGKHALRVGVVARRYDVNNEGGSDSSPLFGAYTFNGFATGFDYADFLLGIPRTTQRYEPPPARTARYAYLAGYLQDDWRFSSRLTVNFGLRYEYGLAPTERFDRRFAFDPKSGNLVVPNQEVLSQVNPLFPKNIKIVTAAEAGFPSRSLVNSQGGLGPRLGFAWRPFEKTVVRAGYGIYYTPLTNILLDPYSGGPFQSSETFTNSLTNGVPLFTFPRPFTSAGSLPTQNVTGVVVNPHTPYTQQWNISFERELPMGIVARASYRGHRTLQLLTQADINKPLPSNNPANTTFFRYPQFFSVNFTQNGGSQLGNMLELQVERKFAQGLTFQGGWTIADVNTDVPGSFDVGGLENPYDRAREWGRDGGVNRHRAVAYATYELPFGTGKRFGSNLPGWVQQAFGNWQTSNILVLQSGFFSDPFYCCDDAANIRNFGGGRPDLVGSIDSIKKSNRSIDGWFNPAAFAKPPAGRLGNAPRGVIENPGLFNYDLGLFKYFQFGERGRVQLRMTSTNILNHANFGGPNTNITSPNVGLIRGINGTGLGGGGRRIKLGLRIDF